MCWETEELRQLDPRLHKVKFIGGLIDRNTILGSSKTMGIPTIWVRGQGL